mmetsp:Transcript_6735/g.11576  ORF Transcript_6735/g.11576 Transcript_6735/m.11576 type:complete len:364 (+) Transcript_6735:67-1158(+)
MDPMSPIDSFATALKRREIVGSFSVAYRTAELMRGALSGRFGSVQAALEFVRTAGKKLSAAQPLEVAAGNIVRRTLLIIREELATFQAGGGVDLPPETIKIPKAVPVQTSMLKYLMDETDEGARLDFSKPFGPVKNAILDAINELLEEIERTHDLIANQALEYIHSNEVIMTYGVSKTVERFLKAAAKKRRTFEVIVAETAPYYRGHDVALKLSSEDKERGDVAISTTLIPDSNIFAMMARVNKVIVGTHAVMANGGLIMPSGGHLLATAARQHSVPFVVLTGLFKLCPLYPHDQDQFNDLANPTHILDFSEDIAESVDVLNPLYDYVPPELVSQFITNTGGHNASYVYRLLQELYHPSDSQL